MKKPAASGMRRLGASAATMIVAALALIAGCASPPLVEKALNAATPVIVKPVAPATARVACFKPTCCDDEAALQFAPHRLNCSAIALSEAGKSAEAFTALQAAIKAARAETVRKVDATEVLCFALNDAAHRADAVDDDVLSQSLFVGNLAACQSRFGQSSDPAAFALWSGASHHIDHGRLDVALPQIERVIALSRSNGNRGLESFAVDALGRIKDRQGKRVEGRRLLQQAIDIKITVFGARSAEVANSYTNMGASYVAAKAGATGRDWYRRAINIYDEVLGPASDDTLLVSSGLVSSHLADGELAQAVRLYDALLPKFVQTYGEADNRTVVLLNDWGAALSAQKKYPQALAKFERALSIRRSTIPNSVRHGSSALNAAKIKKTVSSCAAAEPLRREARAVAVVNMRGANKNHSDVAEFVEAVSAFERECASPVRDTKQ